jgi:hypothetical protein
MLGLTLVVNACSNAAFKGVTGDRSRDDSAPPANDGDATGNNPTPRDNPPLPIPSSPPANENPNTQNPGPVVCDPLGLSLSSLYQIHDESCHQNDTGDSGSDDDDDNDDENDEPGQNDPGQNNPGQNNY